MFKTGTFTAVSRTLCSPGVVHLAPAAAQDAWLAAKEARGQALSAEQLARLEDMPSHYPGHAAIPEAPFVEVIDLDDPDDIPAPAPSATEAGLRHALPAIRAAVAKFGRGGDAA